MPPRQGLWYLSARLYALYVLVIPVIPGYCLGTPIARAFTGVA